MAIQVTSCPFGRSIFGENVTCWCVETEMMRLAVLDYGATVRSLCVKDAAGEWVDVVLGYDTLAEYEANDGYLGAVVGRVCNRIAGAEFELDDARYPLYKNDGENHLHGGKRGFDKYVWTAEPLADGVHFSRVSPDGEEGYPGTMHVSVSYHVEGTALRIDYAAESDRNTLCNLTNHSYFNLNGGGSALGHTLQIFADAVTARTAGLIPTGALTPVTGTKFDFSTPKAVGRDLPGTDAAALHTDGYDDNFCLPGTGLRKAAVLTGDRSGITMTVLTTTPGMQVYTANFLSPRTGKGGAQYCEGGAVCLETQNYPDAIHHANFPSPVLRKGEQYQQTTVWEFACG